MNQFKTRDNDNHSYLHCQARFEIFTKVLSPFFVVAILSFYYRAKGILKNEF